ncbi:hypothetical protein [Caulobacter sp. UNC358MFTsu5.1]|uniref:hypothetical protein n=1 Tax=Caulobacter sp. UNC358MFTsu5.1 TaxID=1449049 RepID=UPI0004A6DD22|nr:hypothetical protein [Caulobacter sp. UNC358MFTsu5.1]
MASRAPVPVSPFGSQDYELLCENLATLREAHIRSRDARPMRVGDLCTMAQDDEVYELVVTDFTDRGAEGWSVCCRIIEAHRR